MILLGVGVDESVAEAEPATPSSRPQGSLRTLGPICQVLQVCFKPLVTSLWTLQKRN